MININVNLIHRQFRVTLASGPRYNRIKSKTPVTGFGGRFHAPSANRFLHRRPMGRAGDERHA
jgi:hypothetical protein